MIHSLVGPYRIGLLSEKLRYILMSRMKRVLRMI
jgi:hypothetical protein